MLRVVVALTILPVVWGLAFVGIKEVLADAGASTLTLLRFAVADVCVLAVMAASPAARPRFERGDRWRLVVLGITGVPTYHLALNWGEERVSASVASLIVAVAPAMVAVGSAMALRTPLTTRRVAGIALAFAGVALLAFGRPEEGSASATRLAGFAVAMLAPLSWAVYTIVSKPMLERIGALRLTATTILLGSVTLVPLLSGAVLSEIAALPAAAWAWTIFLGAAATVGGYLLFVYALSHMDPTRVSTMLYAVPVVAVLSDWLIRGATLGWAVPAAATLVIAGVWLVQRAPARAEAGAEVTTDARAGAGP